MLVKPSNIAVEIISDGSVKNGWMPVTASSRLESLTALRFFAALCVVLHHTQSRWVSGEFIGAMGQFGWLGVSFFFILSGFVLMWGYNPKVSYLHFISRRLARIYPLHLLTLVFALLLFIRFGSPLAGKIGNRWGTVANFLLIHDWWPLNPNVRQAWNGVSWTLSCEFFFYLCAPWLFARLIAMPSRRYWLFPALWAAMLAFALMASMQRWAGVLDMLEYFPVSRILEFALGAAAAMLLKRHAFRIWTLTALTVLILPLTLLWNFVPASIGIRSGPVMIVLVIPGALLLIVSAALGDIRGNRSLLRQPLLVFLGEASFAMYMTHALLLNLMQYFVAKIFPNVANDLVQAESFRLFFVVSAVLLSCFVYYYIEKPLRFNLLQRERTYLNRTVS